MNTREYKVDDTSYIWDPISGKLKIHILAIVDEEYIVYKWYGKHKQRWYYEVAHNYSLTAKIELAEERRKKDGDQDND